jgi:hypothetical protein
MSNTATQQEKQEHDWTPQEFDHYMETGELPEWHPGKKKPRRCKAPDHSTSRKGKTKLSIREHFVIFHHQNPWVYDVLVSYAYEDVAEGHKRLSISRIWERLRARPLETEAKDYKLNNNYRSHYVRMIQENEPALAEMFHTRPLRSL